MTRRTLLAALAASFTQDPEKLLWRPGAKLISIPKPRRPRDYTMLFKTDGCGKYGLQAHAHGFPKLQGPLVAVPHICPTSEQWNNAWDKALSEFLKLEQARP